MAWKIKEVKVRVVLVWARRAEEVKSAATFTRMDKSMIALNMISSLELTITYEMFVKLVIMVFARCWVREAKAALML